ncbi:MAG TPA: hypothetical protein VFL13_12145 [Candidatus Baltobacteraceae bacterium]|nr:hypothetical protein [Candidatus Baltobacteraceae bacterium]
MITAASTLVEIAFEICTALDRCGVQSVLCGGSAATFYTDGYRSRDLDFVITFGWNRDGAEKALTGLGFRRSGSQYAHAESSFTVDFPPGPLAIGADIIQTWETVRRGELLLHVLSRTDSVRDRLAGFYFWNDRSNLQTAVLVAKSGPVDFDTIRDWSRREGANDKFGEFIRALERSR